MRLTMSTNGHKRACQAKNKHGDPCRNPNIRADGYCIYHSTDSVASRGFVPEAGRLGGRPPNPSVPALLRQRAEEHRDQLWQVFATCIQSDDPAIQLKAVDTLLSWLYSKPKQQTELTGTDGGPLQIALADLMRQRAELRRGS